MPIRKAIEESYQEKSRGEERPTMKRFNTTAVCIPSKHYMVDLSERVKEIKKLVDDGKYFTINRARQYGKTTTLDILSLSLSDEYIVINLDFQDIGDAGETVICRKM